MFIRPFGEDIYSHFQRMLIIFGGSQRSIDGVPQHPREMHAAPGVVLGGANKGVEGNSTYVELGCPTPPAPTPGTGKMGQRESNPGRVEWKAYLTRRYPASQGRPVAKMIWTCKIAPGEHPLDIHNVVTLVSTRPQVGTCVICLSCGFSGLRAILLGSAELPCNGGYILG